MRFGKITVVDRRTFEDYWEIQEVIRAYLNRLRDNRAERDKPLSLAVFGPPGGGKSYGVKQLAQTLGGESLVPLPDVNVAQFSSVNDLRRVFQTVRDVSTSGKVPLVFFDEFDASWERKAFGWLRFFLAPMQDGEFGSGVRRIQFGRAIFVFVGAINHSFDMFNGRLHNRHFIEAKGPDFVSRLSRHLDVLGVNQTPDDLATSLVRRAIVLRSKLEDYHPRIIRADKTAAIDPPVVNAFLHVSRFKHGIRSLEALVRTSRIASRSPRFHWGALPPFEQREMHVSVHDFLKARDWQP